MANRVVKKVSLEEIKAARNNGSIFPTPRTITRNAPSSRVINRTTVTEKPSKPVTQPTQKPVTQTAPTVVKPVPASLKNDQAVASVATQPVKRPTTPTKIEIQKAFEDMPLVPENDDMGSEYIAYLKSEARKNKAPANLLHGEYVNKLKAEEIKNIFLPFGYIDHEQMDSQIYVICKDFDVMFSDFTLALDNNVNSSDRKWLTSSKFDYKAFEDTLDQMGLTMEQAIDERVAIWLSERFHSYSVDRKNYKDNNNKNAFKAFATSGANERLVDFMRELKNRQDRVNEDTYNRGYHGYYNPIDKR